MSSGITMRLFNSRGAHWRGKGGDHEREMAEPYPRVDERTAILTSVCGVFYLEAYV
jgi:hypothetical protein